MPLWTPTPEATCFHRPHPFLPARLTRPLTRNVNGLRTITLRSTSEPSTTAQCVMCPNVTNGVPRLNQLPVVRDPHILRAIRQVTHNSVLMCRVYHCVPIHTLRKNRFHDARATGNEGDRLSRPADHLSVRLPSMSCPSLPLKESHSPSESATSTKPQVTPESVWVKAWRSENEQDSWHPLDVHPCFFPLPKNASMTFSSCT